MNMGARVRFRVLRSMCRTVVQNSWSRWRCRQPDSVEDGDQLPSVLINSKGKKSVVHAIDLSEAEAADHAKGRHRSG